MKNVLNYLFTLLVGSLVGIAAYGSYQSHTTSFEEEKTPPQIEYVYVETEPEIITEVVYVPYEEPFYRNLTEEDVYYLKDIAMREAEGEDVIGQAMVMYCVLCRAEAFNQTIKEVCESSAFESSSFRSGITPNENCNQALSMIEDGWEPKPLYFRGERYHSFGTPLFQVGKHYFSTT